MPKVFGLLGRPWNRTQKRWLRHSELVTDASELDRELPHLGAEEGRDVIQTILRRVFQAACMVLLALVLPALLALGGCAAGGVSSGSVGGGGGSGGGPNPLPSIVFLDPSSAAAGGPDFFLTVYGSGFSPSSVVQWDGSTLATTFVSANLVYAVASDSYSSGSGTASVTVSNPAPGGGLSNASSVFIGPAPQPPAGVGVIQLVSAAPDGTAGNGHTYTAPAVSADGRYVAFQSDSTNLVPGPATGFFDIYLRDTCIGAVTGCTPTTTRISVANDGSLPNGNSRSPAISASGRYVAFDSSATNLFPGSTQTGTGGAADVFVRDTCLGVTSGCVPTTILVSVASDGSQPTGTYPSYGDSRDAAISADGRFVAFNSAATNLVPNDTNGSLDVFVRDTCIGVASECSPRTSRVSVADDGSQSNAPTCCPSISADGRYISFISEATNLVPNVPRGTAVLRDTCFGAPVGCTPNNRSLFVGYGGTPPNPGFTRWALSTNARFSGFEAETNYLVPGDNGQMVGAFVYDDCIGAPAGCIPHTDRVSVTFNGGQADSGSGQGISSNDGNYVAFISVADNLLSYAYRSSAVYVRMTCANAPADCVPTTYLLSLDSNTGIQGNSPFSDSPAITPDGRYAVFISTAANWPGSLQSNGNHQVWLARIH